MIAKTFAPVLGPKVFVIMRAAGRVRASGW